MNIILFLISILSTIIFNFFCAKMVQHSMSSYCKLLFKDDEIASYFLFLNSMIVITFFLMYSALATYMHLKL